MESEICYKDCQELSEMFQTVSTNLKNGMPLWDELILRSTRLHVAIRSVLHVTCGVLETLQKLSDLACASPSATKDIGVSLIRLCMRQRSLDAKFRGFHQQLMDSLIQPLQCKLAHWRKSLAVIERERQRMCKRAKSEWKKAQADCKKAAAQLHKRRKKSTGGNLAEEQQQLTESENVVKEKWQCLQFAEQRSVSKLLTEERSRYAFLVASLKPALLHQVAMLSDLSGVEEVLKELHVKCEGTEVSGFTFEMASSLTTSGMCESSYSTFSSNNFKSERFCSSPQSQPEMGRREEVEVANHVGAPTPEAVLRRHSKFSFRPSTTSTSFRSSRPESGFQPCANRYAEKETSRNDTFPPVDMKRFSLGFLDSFQACSITSPQQKNSRKQRMIQSLMHRKSPPRPDELTDEARKKRHQAHAASRMSLPACSTAGGLLKATSAVSLMPQPHCSATSESTTEGEENSNDEDSLGSHEGDVEPEDILTPSGEASCDFPLPPPVLDETEVAVLSNMAEYGDHFLKLRHTISSAYEKSGARVRQALQEDTFKKPNEDSVSQGRRPSPIPTGEGLGLLQVNHASVSPASHKSSSIDSGVDTMNHPVQAPSTTASLLYPNQGFPLPLQYRNLAELHSSAHRKLSHPPTSGPPLPERSSTTTMTHGTDSMLPGLAHLRRRTEPQVATSAGLQAEEENSRELAVTANAAYEDTTIRRRSCLETSVPLAVHQEQTSRMTSGLEANNSCPSQQILRPMGSSPSSAATPPCQRTLSMPPTMNPGIHHDGSPVQGGGATDVPRTSSPLPRYLSADSRKGAPTVTNMPAYPSFLCQSQPSNSMSTSRPRWLCVNEVQHAPHGQCECGMRHNQPQQRFTGVRERDQEIWVAQPRPPIVTQRQQSDYGAYPAQLQSQHEAAWYEARHFLRSSPQQPGLVFHQANRTNYAHVSPQSQPRMPPSQQPRTAYVTMGQFGQISAASPTAMIMRRRTERDRSLPAFSRR